MDYIRKCWWCGKEFETNDVELDYCSIECFHADETYSIQELETELKNGES